MLFSKMHTFWCLVTLEESATSLAYESNLPHTKNSDPHNLLIVMYFPQPKRKSTYELLLVPFILQIKGTMGKKKKFYKEKQAIRLTSADCKDGNFIKEHEKMHI